MNKFNMTPLHFDTPAIKRRVRQAFPNLTSFGMRRTSNGYIWDFEPDGIETESDISKFLDDIFEGGWKQFKDAVEDTLPPLKEAK